MKYGKKSKLSIIALLLLGFLSYSCSEKEIKPETPSTQEVLSPTEQKKKMSTIAQQLIDEMPSSDFRDINDLFVDLTEEYEDYDWDNVEDWAEESWDKTLEFLGTSEETEESYRYIYNYIYNDYKSLFLLSNFYGHFTAKNGEWRYSEAKDLQFIMDDCVIKLEASGNIKKVYVGEWTDWEDYDSDYDYGSDKYVYNEYYDRIKCTIGLPEKIILTLTKNGANVVKCVVTTDLSAITDEHFDISKSGLSLTALIELNNGYKVDLSKCEYIANETVSTSLIISKKGKNLLTMGVAADVTDLPSYNLDAFTSEDNDDIEENFEDANVSKAFVKLDVLGKLQVQGTINNVRGFLRKLEKAADNDSNGSAFKSYINQANELMDINLFYDGGSLVLAYVELESFRDEDWDGDYYWEAEPVICFHDGSSYSTIETFFNEYDFDDVIDAFEKLLEDYEDMIEE